jgi:hypothetical protein
MPRIIARLSPDVPARQRAKIAVIATPDRLGDLDLAVLND